jgi:hypothetical protein
LKTEDDAQIIGAAGVGRPIEVTLGVLHQAAHRIGTFGALGTEIVDVGERAAGSYLEDADPDENSFTLTRTRDGGTMFAVFGVKKEIQTKAM